MLSLFYVFFKIGIFTFGSGYAMLALAEVEIVRSRQWLTAEQFAEAVALAEVTPGPIMVNLATFVGTKLNGFLGAIMATLGLVVPPLIIFYTITRFYMNIRDNAVVEKLLQGLRPAIIGLILAVVLRMGHSVITEYRSLALTLGVLLFVLLGVHPILVVIGASLLGLLIF